MKTIQILGTGCAKCRTLVANAEQAIKEAGIEGEVIKVQEIADILAFDGVRAACRPSPSTARSRSMAACRVRGRLSRCSAERGPRTIHRENEMFKTSIEQAVRDKYGSIAVSGLSSAAQGVRDVAEAFGYTPEELRAIPAEANVGLSCGNPTAFASLRPGDGVVDLGSGGGLDVFLAAQKIGPTGRAIGIDMTPEMVDLAPAMPSRRRRLTVSRPPTSSSTSRPSIGCRFLTPLSTASSVTACSIWCRTSRRPSARSLGCSSWGDASP